MRTVAGEEDFEKAVKAVNAMAETGRGLLVTGRVGCGKTRLVTAIRDAFDSGNRNWVYCKDSDDMEYLRYCEDAMKSNVYIDDIGSEEIVRDYGNVVDVVGDFLQRYHYRGTGRVIATTNLNAEKITEKYGARTLDRMLEMCVVLQFKGGSKRGRVII